MKPTHLIQKICVVLLFLFSTMFTYAQTPASLVELLASPMAVGGCNLLTSPIEIIKQRLESVYLSVKESSKEGGLTTLSVWELELSSTPNITYQGMKLTHCYIYDKGSRSCQYEFYLEKDKDQFKCLNMIIKDFKKLGIPLKYKKTGDNKTEARGEVEYRGVKYEIDVLDTERRWLFNIRIYAYKPDRCTIPGVTRRF